ncbi:MAG: sigma-54 dependent transcriptional regulator [Kofleriaceae bacterium]
MSISRHGLAQDTRGSHWSGDRPPHANSRDLDRLYALEAETLELGRHAAVVADPSMKQVFHLARRLARTSVPVVIHGETGVGKELVAAAVHAASRRADGPFITLNCAAIPDTLAEAELFGHARGAFTGAVTPREGLLEAASGGTLFLDEIAELSATMQARLLRALESGEVSRVGETSVRAIDLRVVCASHKDLHAEVKAGRFRSDLYFRLGAARVEVPPLRERPCDVIALARTFLAAACRRAERRLLTLSAAAYQGLLAHRWPGNVRELRHVLECAVAVADENVLELRQEHLQLPTTHAEPIRAEGSSVGIVTPSFRPVAKEIEELERRRMVEALRATGGVQISAAALISMPMRTFVTKLRRYQIGPADLATR